MGCMMGYIIALRSSILDLSMRRCMQIHSHAPYPMKVADETMEWRRLEKAPAAAQSPLHQGILEVRRAWGGSSHRNEGGWRAAVGHPCPPPSARTGPAQNGVAQSCAAGAAPESSRALHPPSETKARPAVHTNPTRHAWQTAFGSRSSLDTALCGVHQIGANQFKQGSILRSYAVKPGVPLLQTVSCPTLGNPGFAVYLVSIE